MGPPRLGRAVPFYSSEIGFSDDSLSRFSPVFDTTSPGGRAATDGPRWHASRESHPSEDRSELPPLRGPGVTRGCGWAGVSLSLARVGPGLLLKPRPQCDTARHRPFLGRMGTALHLLRRFERGFGGSCAPALPPQVVFAHPPASLQPLLRASRQLSYPVAGYLLVKLHGGSSPHYTYCTVFPSKRNT